MYFTNSTKVELQKKVTEAKNMIHSLHVVYDRKSLRSALLSVGIDIRKPQSICKNGNIFKELIFFYTKEMLAIEKNPVHDIAFSTRSWHPVKKRLHNGKIVTDYYAGKTKN